MDGREIVRKLRRTEGLKHVAGHACTRCFSWPLVYDSEGRCLLLILVSESGRQHGEPSTVADG